jgi:tetratricopeptide (TPR) repeat protein
MTTRKSAKRKSLLVGGLFFLIIAVGFTYYIFSYIKHKSQATESSYDTVFSQAKESLYEWNLENCIRYCKKALKLNPKSADAWELWALVLHFQDKREEAIKMYEKALSLEPNHAAALDGISDLLLIMGRNKEALDYAKHFAEVDPKSPKGYVTASKALIQMKSYNQAQDFLEGAIRADSQYPSAHYYNAICYYRLGLKELGSQSFETAIRLPAEADDSCGWWTKALNYYDIWGMESEEFGDENDAENKYAQALEAYKMALKYCGDNSHITSVEKSIQTRLTDLRKQTQES